MKALAMAMVLGAGGALAAGQAPNGGVHSSDIGLSYTAPAGWETLDAQKTTSAARQQTTQTASEEQRKGVACVEVPLTARHGDPASVIVIVALPFDCFGQTITANDLPGFASGAEQGIKQHFEIVDPIDANYTVAGHAFWIERARATPKGFTAPVYTIEITCSVLKKAAVCWMAQASDAADLGAFEQSAIKIDGEDAPRLVPTDVFLKKP